MKENIHPGECWMAQFSKRELCVRLESRDPDGGWTARVMSHGRKVRIKGESQLLYRCGRNEIYAVAERTTPNRRSRATPPPKAEPAPGRPPKEKMVVETVPSELPASLSLLDAAHKVLSESKRAMTTREIVAACAGKKYWMSNALTPWQTLTAALNRDIQENGTESRFQKRERGKFSLR